MVDDVLSLFDTAVTAVGSWFTDIFEATGMTGVYLSYVFVFLCVSILLMPIIGGRISPPVSASSDSANKKISQGRFGDRAADRAGSRNMRAHGFRRAGDL